MAASAADDQASPPPPPAPADARVKSAGARAKKRVRHAKHMSRRTWTAAALLALSGLLLLAHSVQDVRSLRWTKRGLLNSFTAVPFFYPAEYRATRRSILARATSPELPSAPDAVARFDRADALEIFHTASGAVCRIPGPCLTRGSLTIKGLPSVLKQHRAILDEVCHVTPSSFYDEFTQHNSTYELHPGDLLDDNVTVVDTRSLDLIGGIPAYHYHIPHFAEQLALPLFIFETLFAPDSSVTYKSYSTISNHTESTRPTPVTVYDALRPAFVYVERASRFPLATSWVKQFFQLVPTHQSPSYIYKQDIDRTTHCFRSIIVGRTSAFRMGDNNPLFYPNQLTKGKRGRKCRTQTANILILQREKERVILNVDEVRLAAEQIANRFFAGASVRVLTFEGSSFLAQVAALQQADIFLTSHGAGVTNAAFLRRDSLWVEIFPFMYQPSIFGSLNLWLFRATAATLNSPPDIDGINDRILAQRRNETSAATLLKHFTNGMVAYQAALAKNDPDPIKTSYQTARDAYYYLNSNFREGLRNQNLLVNIAGLKREITAWAKDRCG